MTFWQMVIVAVGSAVAGGLVTYGFARPTGRPAAEKEEQPLTAVALALAAIADTPRQERERDVERSAYVEFLVCVEAAFRHAAPGSASPLAHQRAVGAALDILRLVGPDEVADAAQRLASLATTDHGCLPHEVEDARNAFLNAARSALQRSSVLAPASGLDVPGPLG
ncbi:hypothetical protein ABZ896_10045 [Streptomyces sp. NPDC047072]|uniref:hypothetical protein n=1 Tax=Streptomyces sp. NPDC047072 TaxID=3154809 RepID=UPI0033F0A446